MTKHYHAYQPRLHSPIDLEHRLTVLEISNGDHGHRITDLEGKAATKFTPRDYMLSAAGILMVAGALTEKIGWSHALSALVKLYGGR